MAKDTFSAVWVSHTSLSDFLRCPRSYYLKNVYREPTTSRKIQLMSPPLALGQVVHEVLESRSKLATPIRMKQPLLEQYEQLWKQVTGKKGGFVSSEQEHDYKNRGTQMLQLVQEQPGPLQKMAIKIQQDLPHFWLSEAENIILCGKIDWLEYLPEIDGVHIIDFKTGKHKEDTTSLQLPIYHLLVHYCQKRIVAKASYWYLSENIWEEKTLPPLDEAQETILTIAKQIKTARKLEHFRCPYGKKGCYACLPLEAVLRGEAECIGVNTFKQSIYVLPTSQSQPELLDGELL